MKPIYFISDLHLGAPNQEASLKREQKFVQWLIQVQAQQPSHLFVVGDLFDFWFEYKRAVPRGFVRCLGKLAELADQGVEIHMFTGNHDLWIFDYLPNEIGATLHKAPISIQLQNQHLHIGHGDGLGPGDNGYKFLKKLFTSPLLQWSYARLHPNFGIYLADKMSKLSRKHTGNHDAHFHGAENEWLYTYSREIEALTPHNLYIFGHRHLPIHLPLHPKSHYHNLGDWLQYYTYGQLQDGHFSLKTFSGQLEHDLPAKTFP